MHIVHLSDLLSLMGLQDGDTDQHDHRHPAYHCLHGIYSSSPEAGPHSYVRYEVSSVTGLKRLLLLDYHSGDNDNNTDHVPTSKRKFSFAKTM